MAVVFEPGEEVECQHGARWYPATVLRTMPSAQDPSDMWVEIHFDGWDTCTDRFELRSAGRLRPKGGRGWTLADPPARGEQSFSKEARRHQRRCSVGDAAPALIVGGEQRQELLERGKGLAKLQRLPAAVLSGGLAPPTSGAWRRRGVSKEAKLYESSVRRPLYVSPVATKSMPAHEAARQHGSHNRQNSRRPRTVEGGKGAPPLRTPDGTQRSSQLPATQNDDARKRMDQSAAAVSREAPAQSSKQQHKAPFDQKTPRQTRPRSTGTGSTHETPLEVPTSKSAEVLSDSSFVGYFAVPGTRQVRQASFGYNGPDGRWVAPERPPTAEELEAQRRAASPPLPDPGKEMRKEQLRVLRGASRTCMAARDALRQSNCNLVEIIRSLDSAVDATTTVLKGSRDSKHRAIRSRVYTYRAIAHARNDNMSHALEDLREGLFLNGRDAVALKFQARLQHAVATGYAHCHDDGHRVALHPGQQTSPSRYVPTATAQFKLLGTTGCPSRPHLQVDTERLDITNASACTDLDDFFSSIERVHRDRPYPEWHHRKQSVFAERPPEEPEPERAPSRWDYVIHRVEDLLVDDEDRSETRELLLANIGTLLEVFGYYCKVGSSTIAEGAKQFAMVKPREIDSAGLTRVARETYKAMFTKERIDAPVPYLMTLRQFWQLARDCACVDDHCDIADINRIIMLSGRELAQDATFFVHTIEAVAEWNARSHGRSEETAASNGYPTSPPPVPEDVVDEVAMMARKLQRENSRNAEYSVDGKLLTSTMSVNDDENPHHPNNRFHAYEYVEALLRCAARYCTEKHLKRKGKARGKSTKVPSHHSGSTHNMHGNLRKKLAEQAVKSAGGKPPPLLRLSDCFHAFLSENLLRFSCTHHTMTDDDWTFCDPSLQHLATEFRVPLEKVFRYYSVAKPNTVVQTAGSGTAPSQQFWKVRSLELLDDTMNFNELYRWLEKFELFTPEFKPKHAQKLFARVTGSDEIVAHIHKNNADSEMILDEFIEFLFMVALAHTEPAKTDDSRRKKIVPSKSLRIRKFLQDVVLPAAAAEMPVDSKALAQEVGAKYGAGEGYDGIDSEEEEFTGETLVEIQR